MGFSKLSEKEGRVSFLGSESSLSKEGRQDGVSLGFTAVEGGQEGSREAEHGKQSGDRKL